MLDPHTIASHIKPKKGGDYPGREKGANEAKVLLAVMRQHKPPLCIYYVDTIPTYRYVN